jgi:hypothetical protein
MYVSMTHDERDPIERFCDALAIFCRTRVAVFLITHRKVIFTGVSMLFVIWIFLLANVNGFLGHGHFRFSSARVEGIVDVFLFLYPSMLPIILIAYGNWAWRRIALLLCIPMLVIWFFMGIFVFDIEFPKIRTDTDRCSELLETQRIDSRTNKCLYREIGWGAMGSDHLATCIEKKVLPGLLYVQTIDYRRED